MTERPTDGFTPRESQDTARSALGAALARLRHQQGITGQQLGELSGMSQGKISKIENGMATPAARDVERLARALGAPPDVVEALVDQANGLRDQFTDLRMTARRLTASQRDLAQDEERTTRMAVFQTAVVPGLLQTAEYARAVLAENAAVLRGNEPGKDLEAIPSAVSARISRQEVLYDRDKRFAFVIAEAVLGRVVGSPGEMLAQLQRIGTVGEQDNVDIRILGTAAELDFPPLHGFHLFDDRTVLVDLISTTVVSRGGADLRVYRAVFDHFRERATSEIGPILDTYVVRYAEMARAAAGRARAGG
jgi:transcriptional regulator with XRE-family HTH domain